MMAARADSLQLEVAIDLIVPDNTAFTVLVALRQLGYAALERVERSEIVCLNFAQPTAPVTDLVAKIAHAEILFNPNKHRLSYAPPDQQTPAGDRAPQWEAIVEDRDDATARLVALLAGPFGMNALQSLSRSVAWRLYEPDGTAPRERLEWACRELLANPYSQRFHVRPVPQRITVAQ